MTELTPRAGWLPWVKNERFYKYQTLQLQPLTLFSIRKYLLSTDPWLFKKKLNFHSRFISKESQSHTNAQLQLFKDYIISSLFPLLSQLPISRSNEISWPPIGLHRYARLSSDKNKSCRPWSLPYEDLLISESMWSLCLEDKNSDNKECSAI